MSDYAAFGQSANEREISFERGHFTESVILNEGRCGRKRTQHGPASFSQGAAAPVACVTADEALTDPPALMLYVHFSSELAVLSLSKTNGAVETRAERWNLFAVSLRSFMRSIGCV